MKKPNIILLMTDQHRADHVGFLPGSRLATPNIDRLAESVGFSNCITVNPICTPARACLLTGKYSHQIGMLAMSGDLSLQHPTYMQALQKAGYWTAGVGKFHWLQGWPWGVPHGQGHNLVALKNRIKEYGLDYVWEVSGKQLAQRNYCDYAAHLDRKGLLEAYRNHVAARGPNMRDPERSEFTGEPWPFESEDYVDVVTGNEILRAIDARPETRPFFLFGSFCGPHKPYDPPAEYLERFPLEEEDNFIPGDKALSAAAKQRLYRLRRAYKAMIAVIDDQVGRILDRLAELDLLDNTIILFTSDHGEMLGDHARLSKLQPWRQSVTVPTAVRHPDHLDRRICAVPVEITDLAATMLDFAGLDPVEALSKPWPAFHGCVPCHSLAPIVRGEQDSVRDVAFSECCNDWQMVQSATHKYIRYLPQSAEHQAEERLFDLRRDPDECVNLTADPEAAEVKQELREHLQRIMDTTPPAQLQWAPWDDHEP